MSKLPTFLEKARKLTIKLLGIKNEKDENKYKKNIIIGQTRAKTKLKRLSQVCKVYEFKLLNNNLNKSQKELLPKIFLQSKWISNFALAELNTLYKSEEKIEEKKLDKKGNEYTTFTLKDKAGYYNKVKEKLDEIEKLKEVTVKVGDKFETRSIADLHSSIKAEMMKQLLSDFRSIAASRKKGKKTGACSFKKSVSSVNLKQYGKTHEMLSDKVYKIAKLGKVRVKGIRQLKQFDSNYELANAKLVSKPTGFFIKQTVYSYKDNNSFFDSPEELSQYKPAVGIDFGIRSQMTLSDGLQFKIRLGETDKLKKLQKKFNRSVSKLTKKLGVTKLNHSMKSANHCKRLAKVNKEYHHIREQRLTVKRKFCSFVKHNYGTIVVQDENIHEWHKSKMKGYGKRVQNGGMGAIIGNLRKIPTSVTLSKRKRTTGICCGCGYTFPREDFGLEEVILDCPKCIINVQRDLIASIVIEEEGTGKRIPLERRKFTLLEIKASEILTNVSLLSLIKDRRNHVL